MKRPSRRTNIGPPGSGTHGSRRQVREWDRSIHRPEWTAIAHRITTGIEFCARSKRDSDVNKIPRTKAYCKLFLVFFRIHLADLHSVSLEGPRDTSVAASGCRSGSRFRPRASIPGPG